MRLLLALALTLWVHVLPAKASPRQVDLMLLLAVDCSGSVNEKELRLQLNGIAAALRDPEVIESALAGPNRRIAVNVLNWADANYEKFATGWHEIASTQDALKLAQLVERFDKRAGGGTGIGTAMVFGIGLMESSGIKAFRKVIDISGDGIEAWEGPKPKVTLKDAHVLREAADVTVNGLAIRSDFHNLDTYYRENVAAGPGSFVMEINDYGDYAVAIRRKMLREIRPSMAGLSSPIHVAMP